MIKKISHIVSFVFSPLLVPTYGVALAMTFSYLALAGTATRLGVTSVIFIITCIFPLLLIALLWKLGKVSDPGLNERGDRTLPYVITAASYIASMVYLGGIKAPVWMMMFFGGALLAVIICIIVNRWWKISAHMTAMGGLLALAFRIAVGGYAIRSMLWLVFALVVVCGVVATARLVLERHTLGQVTAGFVNGFVCVSGLSILAEIF